jgi:hypothetical protein
MTKPSNNHGFNLPRIEREDRRTYATVAWSLAFATAVAALLVVAAAS